MKKVIGKGDIMFTQVDYCSHQSGSSCPFCGQDLSIDCVSDKFYFEKRVRFKIYQCTCPQKHLCFMIIENIDLIQSLTKKTLCVLTADLEDYVNEQPEKNQPKETGNKHVERSSQKD